METIHLIGSEQVQSAASRMASAADDMLRAAANIDGSVSQMERVLQRFAEDMAGLVERFEIAAAIRAGGQK